MSQKPPNYYEVLSLHYAATNQEIRDAFKELRNKHPDWGGDEEQFKLITAARDVLLDPIKRAKHDGALRQAGYIFQREAPNIAEEIRIIRNTDTPAQRYRTPTSDYDDFNFIEVEVDLDEYDSSSERPLIRALTRLFGTLFWLAAAVGCYFVAPFITRPFNDVTTFGGDIIALLAGIFRLVVYIAIPACVIMSGYTLFHRRQD